MRLRFAKATAFGLFLCLTACHKKVASNPPATPPPEPPPSVLAIQEADSAYARGDFAGADAKYDEYLRDASAGDQRDRALFQRAVIYSRREFQAYNPQMTTEFLKRLVADYPWSTLKPVAQLILDLQNDNGQLAANREEANRRSQELLAQIGLVTGAKEQSEQKIHQLVDERDQLLKQVQELMPNQEIFRQFATGGCSKIVPELEASLRQPQPRDSQPRESQPKERDVATFVLAFCYASPDYKANNWERANNYFNQIEATSPFKPIAKLLQSQHADLEKVKEIDSQRRRR